MGTTFQDLIDAFCDVREMQYRDDPEEAAARMESIEFTIKRMLEMLRDKFDPR
jgi:hypothetical protein